MSGATSLEVGKGAEEKVLDTSIWKIKLKAGNPYDYTINVEDKATGKTTRNISITIYLYKMHNLCPRNSLIL